jgi:hypothetical protein
MHCPYIVPSIIVWTPLDGSPVDLCPVLKVRYAQTLQNFVRVNSLLDQVCVEEIEQNLYCEERTVGVFEVLARSTLVSD